jgi:hypothetical protein
MVETLAPLKALDAWQWDGTWHVMCPAASNWWAHVEEMAINNPQLKRILNYQKCYLQSKSPKKPEN